MFEIFSVIYPVFGMILLGYIATALKLINKEQLGGLGGFVIKIGIPALLIINIPAQTIADLWQPQYLVSYGLASLIMFSVMLLLYSRHYKAPLNHAAIFALGGSMSNTGFIGSSILLLILGPSAAIYFAMTFIVENFIVFLMFLVCLEISRQKDAHAAKILIETLKNIVKNPIIIGLTTGTVLCIFGLQLPQAMINIVEPISKTAGPLGLFVVGGSLYGIKTLKNTGRDARLMFLSKMLCMPLLVYLLFLCMPNTNPEMIFAGVLLSSISMVTMFSVFGQSFNLGERTSAILLLCTVANLVTIPVIIAVLMP